MSGDATHHEQNSILINCLSRTSEVREGRFRNSVFPQKVFSAIWAVESEVNNGGFSQYFQNTSSETAPFVVEASKLLALPHRRYCRRAIAVAFPVDCLRRQKISLRLHRILG